MHSTTIHSPCCTQISVLDGPDPTIPTISHSFLIHSDDFVPTYISFIYQIHIHSTSFSEFPDLHSFCHHHHHLRLLPPPHFLFTGGTFLHSFIHSDHSFLEFLHHSFPTDPYILPMIHFFDSFIYSFIHSFYHSIHSIPFIRYISYISFYHFILPFILVVHSFLMGYRLPPFTTPSTILMPLQFTITILTAFCSTVPASFYHLTVYLPVMGHLILTLFYLPFLDLMEFVSLPFYHLFCSDGWVVTWKVLPFWNSRLPVQITCHSGATYRACRADAMPAFWACLPPGLPPAVLPACLPPATTVSACTAWVLVGLPLYRYLMPACRSGYLRSADWSACL